LPGPTPIRPVTVAELRAARLTLLRAQAAALDLIARTCSGAPVAPVAGDAIRQLPPGHQEAVTKLIDTLNTPQLGRETDE
jgi:hypothetical protein